MTVVFTDEETEWIYTREYGWPIKEGCPEEIRKSIEKKKKLLERQKEMFEKGK